MGKGTPVAVWSLPLYSILVVFSVRKALKRYNIKTSENEVCHERAIEGLSKAVCTPGAGSWG